MRIKDLSYKPPSMTIKENVNEYCITFNTAKNLNGLIKSIDQKKLDNNKKWVSEDVWFSNMETFLDYLENDYGKDKTKTQQSINRAKSMIYDLINSNNWDYFITLTIDPKKANELKIDPKNIRQVTNYITKFFRNQNRKHDNNIKYVLIPEYHKNGNVHIHGVVKGIRKKDLTKALNNQEYLIDENGIVKLDEYGKPIKNKYYKTPLIRKGNQVYNYPSFSLGFTDFEEIRHKERIGSYCTKYINKDLEKRCNEFGAHLYLCSKGLERTKKVVTKELETFKKLDNETIKKAFPKSYFVDLEYCQKIIINKNTGIDIPKIMETLSNINVAFKDNQINNSMVAAQMELIKENGLKGVKVGEYTYMYDNKSGEFMVKDKCNKVHEVDVQLSLLDYMLSGI